jgi:hypothetical protein
LAPKAPTGSDWVHEIKFDGYRMAARIERGGAAPDLGIPIPSKRGALLGGEATHVHHNLRPMTIFDDFSQRKTDPRPDGEAEFACLNRSGRPDGWRVRQLVDESLAHYPVEHRDILAARFSLRQRCCSRTNY